MRCNRCGYAVPEWLWLGDDHPVLVGDRDIQLTRNDSFDDNTILMTAAQKVRITMCSDVNVRPSSDFIDIGPECFSDIDEAVISWKGRNYYRACGKLVTGRLNGAATTCVKRVGHQNNCEDYDGTIKEN